MLGWLAVAIMAPGTAPASDQILIGPAFEAFVHRSDRLCPARHMRALKPADLDWYEEGFTAQLPRREQTRLTTDPAVTRCAHTNGLSCPSFATLALLQRDRLLPRFVAYSCAHDLPR